MRRFQQIRNFKNRRVRDKKRQRRDSNSRGQSPLVFETNSLTTRTRCRVAIFSAEFTRPKSFKVFRNQKTILDSPGFEPGAFCMQSRRDTTTPQARQCLVPLNIRNIVMPDASGARAETIGKRAAPGIEPGTSRTRSGNHTTRPRGLLSMDLCEKQLLRVPLRLIYLDLRDQTRDLMPVLLPKT